MKTPITPRLDHDMALAVKLYSPEDRAALADRLVQWALRLYACDLPEPGYSRSLPPEADDEKWDSIADALVEASSGEGLEEHIAKISERLGLDERLIRPCVVAQAHLHHAAWQAENRVVAEWLKASKA